MTTTPPANVGVTGLAVMGRNLARNRARHGHVVGVHHRSQSRTDALVAAYGSDTTFVPSGSVEEFVAAAGSTDPASFHTQWSRGALEVRVS